MESNAELVAAAGGENFAETLAREIKAPVVVEGSTDGLTHFLIPPGWDHRRVDDEKLLSAPRRAVASAVTTDAGSFLAYVNRYSAGALTTTTWCEADFPEGRLAFTSLLNDHQSGIEGQAGWRDHRVTYAPALSVEWKRWSGHDRKPFTQAEFAAWIEDNRTDIASAEGMPTGAQMLEMALSMEAAQDVRFKSAIRLTSGGVQLQYVQDDDAQTLARMQLFERFAIGIPVFWGVQPHRINARLRYRVRDGKVAFWYELERADRTFEDAAAEIIHTVREGVVGGFFFGRP